MTTETRPTRIEDYIRDLLPWAHPHQIKALATFVAAILEKQTGNQAEPARTQGNQELALKRLSRLIHNERLNPGYLADCLCQQSLQQVPRTGKVHLAIDWAIEDTRHLLVVSLIVGRGAMPIFRQACNQSVLKGRMRMYEQSVLKRAFRLIFQSTASASTARRASAI